MQIRGAQIAGGLAIIGVIVLLVLTVLPQDGPTTVVVPGSEDSVLAPPTDTPEATPTSSVEPTKSPEPTAEAEATPSPESDNTPDEDDQPAELPVEERASVRVQVLNGGAPDGAAGLAAGALAAQAFQPRDPDNAVESSPGTQVLYAESQQLAAVTVGRIVGAESVDIVPADSGNPNWAAFGNDLDVLVVLGPPLP